MKKLLVLALAAIMVLSVAAVSMAAVTVGGEVNFGFNMKSESATDKSTINDFADAKVTATAALNDEVTAFAAIKSDSFVANKTFVDEAWVKFTEGFGTFKVGYFGWNPKENLDILAPIGDLKTDAGMNLVANVAEGVALDVYLAEQYDKTALGADGGMLYGLKVKYDAESFGVALGYADYSYTKDTENVINLNAYYKLDAFKVFLTYAPEWKDVAQAVGAKDNKLKSAIVGFTYDSADMPFYARAEYDVQAPENCESAYGVRLGYKLTSGPKIEYQITQPYKKGEKSISYIKLNCAF